MFEGNFEALMGVLLPAFEDAFSLNERCDLFILDDLVQRLSWKLLLSELSDEALLLDHLRLFAHILDELDPLDPFMIAQIVCKNVELRV